LIHDIYHTGKSNNGLVLMQTPAAVIYKNQSVAEQNSVDVAWTMLMDSDFDDLKACIYTTKTELKRFRQMTVNAVLATDTADRRLEALRKKRLEQALFDDSGSGVSGPAVAATTTTTIESNDKRSHRKATIFVLEYVLQASDFAHAIQHWQTNGTSICLWSVTPRISPALVMVVAHTSRTLPWTGTTKKCNYWISTCCH
jgi:hypothetical protein